jgi:PadR family transcriptional regulator PadR
MVLEKMESANKKFRKELKSGTVALVILGVLNTEDRPMYGYQITKHFDAFLPDGPDLKMGALYPVLRSLERNGILTSKVEPSISGPPRKYYRLTDRGRNVFKDWKDTWKETRDFVDAILKG